MRDNENVIIDNENQEGGFDIRVILGYLRANWPLFVASVAVCLALAFAYLRYVTPIYNVSAKVLLQDSEKGGSVLSPSDMLADFGMQGRRSNVENEIQLMSSMAVVRGAVVDAGLYVKYYSGEALLYKDAAPFVVSLDNATLSNLEEPLALNFAVNAAGEVTLACDYCGNVDRKSVV